MRVFILEDCWGVRENILRSRFPADTNFVLAARFDEAIRILSNDSDFDVFSLDHDISFLDPLCTSDMHDADLGICSDCVTIDKNGIDLIKWIRDKNIGSGKIFVIHTDNPAVQTDMAKSVADFARKVIVAPALKRIHFNILDHI